MTKCDKSDKFAKTIVVFLGRNKQYFTLPVFDLYTLDILIKRKIKRVDMFLIYECFVVFLNERSEEKTKLGPRWISWS